MGFDLSQAKICTNCEFVFGQILYKCPRCNSEEVFALVKWFKSALDEKIKELEDKMDSDRSIGIKQ